MAAKKDIPLRDPRLGSIPAWRGIARSIGWPEEELRTIDGILPNRTPGDRGEDSVVIFVDRSRIVTATPQWIDQGTRFEQKVWGHSTWSKAIVATAVAPVASGPEGYKHCDVHQLYCPEDAAEGHDDSQTVEICGKHRRYCHFDDEGCTRERDFDKLLAHLGREDAPVRIELDYGGCDCRKAVLGEHYPGCRFFVERTIDFDALFAPPPPERVIKREIDIVPRGKKDKKRALPGQEKLF